MKPPVPLPERFKRLPVDHRGYRVPRFVTWIDGKADFRLADTQWVKTALARRLCFLCGEPLGRYMAFVIGPMCAVNRVTSEPPCHVDCATYAVQVCPFMVFPQRGRDSDNLPDKLAPPGFVIPRNPGVALVWVTKSFELRRAALGGKGNLISIGPATSQTWWCRGRPATLAEVMDSIESGLPALREIAAKYDGPDGERELEDLIAATIKDIKESPWPEHNAGESC